MEPKPYVEGVEGLVAATEVQYFADQAINNSSLKLILDRSAGHFKQQSKSKSSPAKRIGSLVHSMILDADSLKNYLIFEDGKTLTSQKAETFIEANPDKAVILQKDWDLADAYQAANFKNQYVMALRACQLKEVCAFVNVNGFRCKAKADAIDLDNRIVYDLKTTTDIASFRWDAKKYKYHMQRAWYLKLFNLVFGFEFEFKLVLLEKTKPFFCVEREFSEAACLEGEDMVDEAFDKYSYAVTYNDWSGPETTGQLDWT